MTLPPSKVPDPSSTVSLSEQPTATFDRRRVAWAIGASLLIVLGFVWLLQRGALPVFPERAFARVAWWALPAYVGLVLLATVARCVRWHWLLAPIHPLPMRRIFTVNLMFMGAILLLPFRMGEAVRPALFRKKGKLSAWAALGTVGAERIVDGLFASLTLVVALKIAEPRSPLPDRIGALPVPVAVVPALAYSMVWLFALAFLAMAFFYWRRAWAQAILKAVLSPLSQKLASFVEQKLEHLADGLGFLPRLRYLLPFLAFTALFWAMNVLSVWALLLGSGLSEASIAQSAVIVCVLVLGLLVPTAPGFFGLFQISVYAGLALYFPVGVVVNEGSVAVFWLYVLQVCTVLTLALGAFVVEQVWGGE